MALDSIAMRSSGDRGNDDGAVQLLLDRLRVVACGVLWSAAGVADSAGGAAAFVGHSGGPDVFETVNGTWNQGMIEREMQTIVIGGVI